mmetsp:Transcript_90191/g.252132  ORF Transcript_90191/g.252132 Transcript_90191/m.252132 type:complete len:233 (-) Transcript_90191:187-885(-)
MRADDLLGALVPLPGVAEVAVGVHAVVARVEEVVRVRPGGGGRRLGVVLLAQHRQVLAAELDHAVAPVAVGEEQVGVAVPRRTPQDRLRPVQGLGGQRCAREDVHRHDVGGVGRLLSEEDVDASADAVLVDADLADDAGLRQREHLRPAVAGARQPEDDDEGAHARVPVPVLRHERRGGAADRGALAGHGAPRAVQREAQELRAALQGEELPSLPPRRPPPRRRSPERNSGW